MQEALIEHALVAEADQPKKGKRKQAVLKTRKSLGKGGGDTDDDFRPIKAPQKKRAPPPAKPSKKVADDEDEDVKPAAPKRKAATKKAIQVGSDSESEIEIEKRAPPKKAPIKTIDIDSESEPEVVAPKAKGKAPAKRKRYVIHSQLAEHR